MTCPLLSRALAYVSELQLYIPGSKFLEPVWRRAPRPLPLVAVPKERSEEVRFSFARLSRDESLRAPIRETSPQPATPVAGRSFSYDT